MRVRCWFFWVATVWALPGAVLGAGVCPVGAPGPSGDPCDVGYVAADLCLPPNLVGDPYFDQPLVFGSDPGVPGVWWTDEPPPGRVAPGLCTPTTATAGVVRLVGQNDALGAGVSSALLDWDHTCLPATYTPQVLTTWLADVPELGETYVFSIVFHVTGYESEADRPDLPALAQSKVTVEADLVIDFPGGTSQRLHVQKWEAASGVWFAMSNEFEVQGPAAPSAARVEIDARVSGSNIFHGRAQIREVRVQRVPRPGLTTCQVETHAYQIVPPGADPDTWVSGFVPVAHDDVYPDAAAWSAGFDLGPGGACAIPSQSEGFPTRLQGYGVQRCELRIKRPTSGQPGFASEYNVSLYLGGLQTWRRARETYLEAVVTGEGQVLVDERPAAFQSLDCDSDPCGAYQTDFVDRHYFREIDPADDRSSPAALSEPAYTIYRDAVGDVFRRIDLVVTPDGDGFLGFRARENFLGGVVVSPKTGGVPGEVDAAHLRAVDALAPQLARQFALHYAHETRTTALRGPRVGSYVPGAGEGALVLFREDWMRAVERESRPENDAVLVPQALASGPDETTLRLHAVAGEFEPVTFSLWPRQDLHDVQISASALTGPGGTVPAGAVRVWYLQPGYRRSVARPDAFSLRGDFLPDWAAAPRDLYAGVTQRAWLNVAVPAGTAPGVYAGTVVVTASDVGVAPRTVDIELTVRGFDLIRPERFHVQRFGGNAIWLPYPELCAFDGNETCFDDPTDPSCPAACWDPAAVDWSAPPDPRTKLHFQKLAIEDLAAHGARPEFRTTSRGGCDPALTKDLEWELDALGVRRNVYLEAIKQWSPDFDPNRPASNDLFVDIGSSAFCGIEAFDRSLIGSPPVFDPDACEANQTDHWCPVDVERYVRAIYAYVRSQGFGGKIYAHASGEESHFFPGSKNFTAWQLYLASLKLLAATELTQMRVLHTANTEAGHGLAGGTGFSPIMDNVDVYGLGMFHGVDQIDAAVQLADADARGLEKFLYGVRGRFVAGFYNWKAGSTGSFHEFYSYYSSGAAGNAWDSSALGWDATGVLDKGPSAANATFSADGRMVGSWFWEEIREGHDDDAYLTTLDAHTQCSAPITSGDLTGWSGTFGDFTAARAELASLDAGIDLSIDWSRNDLTYRPIDPESFALWREQAAAATETLSSALAFFYAAQPGAADADFDGLACLLEVGLYETSPDLADSDGDGLDDGAEVAAAFTDPGDPDSDGDGLSDGAEGACACDPLDPDSDDDQLSDADEFLMHGTDPGVDDTDGDGVRDGVEVILLGSDPLDDMSFGEAAFGWNGLLDVLFHQGILGAEVAATLTRSSLLVPTECEVDAPPEIEVRDGLTGGVLRCALPDPPATPQPLRPVTVRFPDAGTLVPGVYSYSLTVSDRAGLLDDLTVTYRVEIFAPSAVPALTPGVLVVFCVLLAALATGTWRTWEPRGTPRR